MICKECQKQGLKSRVQEIGSRSTLLATRRSWDENGNEQIHNPNQTTTRYLCSNAHQWEETS